ncbi:MAG: 4'-phosphopantetheinyl transferase superfamily protein [Pyrinomonadaceae bacterium]|jgi:4'-phosphopantetheinyl transferase|nr:4'-phosphopantetheinyl transferase superfamily protein [Pyrinomonadaceae bacterium]
MKGTSVNNRFESAPTLNFDTSWTSPPKDLTLGEDEVHVWRAALSVQGLHVQSLLRTLTADERARAERFHFQKDREQFIVARGLLRTILGRYLDVDPRQLRFAYSSYGKPSLAGEFNAEALCFNLSHADGLALYAVTRGRQLGIDIESVRADLADEQVAERFFSIQEVAAFRALPGNMQCLAFFNCWTRKEAYIKARGEGLSLPLDQFDVSLAPGTPAALLRTYGDHREVSRWSLRELALETGSVAALAVEGHGWRLKCYHWPKESHEAAALEA